MHYRSRFINDTIHVANRIPRHFQRNVLLNFIQPSGPLIHRVTVAIRIQRDEQCCRQPFEFPDVLVSKLARNELDLWPKSANRLRKGILVPLAQCGGYQTWSE